MGLFGWSVGLGGIAAAAVVIFVPEWTMFPPSVDQVGPPPTSMLLFHSGQKVQPVPQSPPGPVKDPDQDALNLVTGGYKNVKVLGDLPPAEFMKLQYAITDWVAPKQGCAFCHDAKDYSSDAKPQKIAARLMLQMTRDINANWTNHVSPAGVTCYTCHRGQGVPAETWFPEPPHPDRPMVARQEPYQEAADTVRKFFPDNGWAEYLLQDEPISAQSLSPLPTGQVHSSVVVKRIYEMMMQMSDGMGVNCTYCHNSRAFFDWSQSTPQRWTAHYALKQNQELNRNYMLPLSEQLPMTRIRVHQTDLPVLPPEDRMPLEGNGFVVCGTCHLSQPKPMGGANVISQWPGLVGKPTQTSER